MAKIKPCVKIIDGHKVGVIKLLHSGGKCTLESNIRYASTAFTNYDCSDITKALYYVEHKNKLVSLIGCYKFKKVKGKYQYKTVVVKHNKENEITESYYFDEDAYLNRQGRTWYENYD